MNRLWAPWRIKYVSSKTQNKCIFCEAKKNTRKHKVIFKTKKSIIMLNIYPYNNGHIMIAPLRHVGDLLELNNAEVIDIFNSSKIVIRLLKKILKPHGYNLGLNLGRPAGAGIPGHLHLHIVPRWNSDTNFMPAVFSTKIISQSLDELQKKLKDAYAKTN